MSGPREWTALQVPPRSEWRSLARRGGRYVYGDRIGLVLWLGLVVALGLTWRVGFFITDSYAIANALVNVADGRLAITENVYSLTLQSQPGLHESGGRLYARNYGQVVLAAPVVWALQAATLVAPLHLVLVAGWTLAVLAFFQQLGAVLDRPAVRGVGLVAALGTFAVNALRPAALDPDVLHLAALQASTILTAAFGGVLFYRLVGVFHRRQVAVGAGVAAVLALPIGFWASIPKRHVLVATLLVGSVYCFARSRRADGRTAERAIAGAYVFASLIAWVHAFEGFFVLVTLGSVDLLTGGVRDRRRLAVVGLAVGVGLAPMFLTNVLISGNPLQPPRLLPSYGPGSLELGPAGQVGSTGGGATGGQSDPFGGMGDAGGGGAAEGGSGGSGGSGGEGGWSPLSVLASLLGPLRGPMSQAGFILAFVVATVADGVAVLGDPERLWHVFGRSGRIPGLRYAVNDYEMVDLTVLESAPLVGGLLALPAVAVRRLRRTRGRGAGRALPWRYTPAGQTDVLVLALGLVLTVVYLSRLPLFSMITVRYIVYAMPMWLYGVVRLPPVGEALARSPRRAAVTYGAVAVGGTLAIALFLGTLNVAIGEAMQFHGLVNLWAAFALASLVAGRALAPALVSSDWMATALGVVTGSTTAFLLLAALEYFQYGPYALGVARELSNALPVF